MKKTTSELTFTNTETMKYYVLNIVDLKNDKEHCRESIYLPYKFDNIKYSLVHSLLRQRKISKALFGYQLDKKSKQGKMFFGGIPKPWIENKYYGKCMVAVSVNYSSYFDRYFLYAFCCKELVKKNEGIEKLWLQGRKKQNGL